MESLTWNNSVAFFPAFQHILSISHIIKYECVQMLWASALCPDIWFSYIYSVTIHKFLRNLVIQSLSKLPVVSLDWIPERGIAGGKTYKLSEATLLSPNLEPVFSPTHVFRECLFHQTLVNSRDYSLKYLQCLFAFVWLVEKWNIIMEGKIMESSFPHFSNELGHICL